MIDLIGPFIFGLVGSLHCLGMCGPLVVAYSLHLCPPAADGRMPGFWPNSTRHHLAFHSGRLFTYGLLGAVAAGIGRFGAFQQFFAGFRSSFTLAGGVLMLLFGLGLLRIIPVPFPSMSFPGRVASFPGRSFPRLLSSPGLSSKLALGLGVGFLPCMLSFAMIVKAATTANLLLGFLTMVIFGIGTLPVLFFTGLFASLLSMKTRLLGERMAGVTVIMMGLILIFKGGKYFM